MKVSTYIITSITACPITLSAKMLILTFITELTEHKNDHDIWGWKCLGLWQAQTMWWGYFIVLWFRILVIITCKLWYTFFFFLKYILLVKISKVSFIFQIRNDYMRDIAENIDPDVAIRLGCIEMRWDIIQWLCDIDK